MALSSSSDYDKQSNDETSNDETATTSSFYRISKTEKRVTRVKKSASELFGRIDNRNSTNTSENRRRKTNKYAQFSKTDQLEQDPLEALVEESNKKWQQLQEELQKKKQRSYYSNGLQQQHDELLMPSISSSTTLPLQFPDAAKIDPYDPTTFGYVEIGTLLGPHGVHGFVKVEGCTDFPERFTTPNTLLHLRPKRKRAPRPITLSRGKQTGIDSFLIQFEGYYDRDAAQSLQGATVYYAMQQDTVELSEEEVRLSDLVGLDVYRRTKVGDGDEFNDDLVGTVNGVVLSEDLCPVPGLMHDQIEISLKTSLNTNENHTGPQQLVLVPLVPQIVPLMDIQNKYIVIDPPDGLLDLTYVREEKVKIKGLLAPAKG